MASLRALQERLLQHTDVQRALDAGDVDGALRRCWLELHDARELADAVADGAAADVEGVCKWRSANERAALKGDADAALRRGDLPLAVQLYTKALRVTQGSDVDAVAVLHCNRAQALLLAARRGGSGGDGAGGNLGAALCSARAAALAAEADASEVLAAAAMLPPALRRLGVKALFRDRKSVV